MTSAAARPRTGSSAIKIYLRPTRKRANARPEALAPGTALVPQYLTPHRARRVNPGAVSAR